MFGQQPIGNMGKVIVAAGVLAGIVGFTASGAKASVPFSSLTSPTLQDLINASNTSGGVVIGDKLFSDFSYIGAPPGAPNPAPTPSQIAVGTAPGSDIGLTFSSAWESALGLNQDSIIRYAVSVLPTSRLMITDVGLRFNGNAPIPSTGTFATVTETVSTLNSAGTGPGTLIGQVSVIADGAGSSSNRFSDHLTFAPTSSVFVEKDIQLNSTDSGVATISFVDNTFSQTVPEPATFSLLGLAGTGLLARRRRS